MVLINYAFTLRRTSANKKVSRDDYIKHMSKIFDDNGLVVFDYEFENERGLHCHGCVSVPIKFEDRLYKLRVRGWRCHMVPIYDLSGWIAYYNKHIKKKVSEPYAPTSYDLEEFERYAQTQKVIPTGPEDFISNEDIDEVQKANASEKETQSVESSENFCSQSVETCS